jgi:hypothetical protein
MLAIADHGVKITVRKPVERLAVVPTKVVNR